LSSTRDDEIELRKLAYRYAYAIDHREWELIPRVFGEDAHLEGPGFEMDGHEQLRAGLPAIEMYSATMHYVMNQMTEIEGDQAKGVVYCLANHIYEKEGVPHKLDMGIRYRDRYVRSEGHWLIEHRVLGLVWQQDLPLELSGTGASS
jgi:hypothetical protein